MWKPVRGYVQFKERLRSKVFVDNLTNKCWDKTSEFDLKKNKNKNKTLVYAQQVINLRDYLFHQTEIICVPIEQKCTS